ncbi:type IV pilus modification protein PilV [Marinobacter sp. 1Y8]
MIQLNRKALKCRGGMTQQSGFGMIEILIAVLILAIGLLGMGSMQTTGLQQTTEARNRSQAVFLAQDMLERVRANRAAVASYALAAGNAPACNTAFAIDNSAVDANDQAEWKNALACLLPGGDGSVAVNGQNVVVTVTWDPQLVDPNSTNDGNVIVEADI